MFLKQKGDYLNSPLYSVFFSSSNKYLLEADYVLDPILGIGVTFVNKQTKFLIALSFYSSGRVKQ